MKVTVPIFIYAKPDGEDNDRFEVYSKGRHHWATDGTIKLNEVPIEQEFEIPNLTEQELLHRAIATLRERKARILAMAEKDAQNIQKQIDQLLLIEYKPAQDLDDDIPF